MNKFVRLRKLKTIFTADNVSDDKKIEKIIKLFEDEEYLNMQYYMEYCILVGYITPMDWIKYHKHF